ncbi:MAG: electron transfer flavoprotein subunit beta/FixA family protein [Dehalococcoidales bacterium]|jgi:electron transfer flavoprotein beta subunit|nr:electron transfer flavoprotein subunit beta [Dehalococcoidales bacterium]MDP6127838.1 electron transfer flavoprotein subunit beta/FixA family protein [Dehalococcoidales bacterium]MDP6501186.1 electron transfer flavoprotein subunit beta/FixA family protein [Dehalococcoidales bacterium]MDP6632220.1 electron transfer flavoprotein subunit beta/FixA family protein [Dehalococcoidales bacterium]MDP6824913.1 electron transfer flavoprotein subunit beta/FixA family protein [Dehalococcoidales bacterium
MDILVCLKQVPGTTKVNINPETNTLVRQGIESIINPFDSYALEEGVRLKEWYGGKVTAISMGPPQAEETLKEAISCGADEAILIGDRAFAGSDTLATSYTLSRAIEKIEHYDLIICGRQTIDGDTAQVGPELAELLEIPFISYVSEVEEIANGRMRVQRAIEEGHEEIESPLPALITVAKEINVPRLPSLRGRSRAKSAVIPTWDAETLNVDPDRVGLTGSPTRVIKIFLPQRTRDGELLQGSQEEQVESLINKLKKDSLI